MAEPISGRFDLGGADMADAFAGAGLGVPRVWATASVPVPVIREPTPSWIDLDLSHVDPADVVSDAERLRARWRAAVGGVGVAGVGVASHRVRLVAGEADAGALALARRVRRAEGVGSLAVIDPDLAFLPQWGWPLRVLRDAGGVAAGVADEPAGPADPGRVGGLLRIVDLAALGAGSIADFAFIADDADVRALARTYGVRVNALVYSGTLDDAGLWSQVRALADQLCATAIIVPDVDDGTSLASWFERVVEEVSHQDPLDVAIGKASTRGIAIIGRSEVGAPLEDIRGRMRDSYISHVVRTRGQVTVRLPPVLELPAQGAAIDDEVDPAHQVREVREANELDIDLLPEPDARRILEYAITRDGVAATAAFRGGAAHEFAIWIGDGLSGAAHARTPAGEPAFIDDPDLAEGARAEVVVWARDLAMQRRVVRIGRSRKSETASFDIVVPAEPADFALYVALVLDGRLAQSGVIRGPVTATGDATEGGEPIEFVVGPELADLGVVAPGGGADAMTLIEQGDTVHGMAPPGSGEEALFDRPIGSIELSRLDDHFEQSVQILVTAQSDSKKSTWLASKDGAKAFAELAAIGFRAYRSLVDAFANPEPERLRAITDSTLVHVAVFDAAESRLAIELLYDREKPDPGAGWCAGFDEALETGTCPVCRPWDPAVDVEGPIPVCPAGFWGVRKQIERVSQEFVSPEIPAALHNRRSAPGATLEGLANLRVGVSDRVDSAAVDAKKPTEVMLDAIRAAVPGEVSLIRDWTTWRTEIESGRPQLLVLLTHSEQQSLELGAADLVDSDRIKSTFVRTPFADSPPGPVVLLLGCDTSTTTELSSFVQTFRARGASVVIGTIGRTLGRYAAPIAGELIALFNDPAGPATVGEALTIVRRRTMRKGWVTGLLMTAFTDSSYSLRR